MKREKDRIQILRAGVSDPFGQSCRGGGTAEWLLIPPEWEFQSEVWAYERKPVRETVYGHDSEVPLFDGESSII